MRKVLLLCLLFVAVGTIAGGGCWMDMWRPRGEVAVYWTIGGVALPGACVLHGGRQVELRAIDDGGSLEAIAVPSCDAFGTSIPLDEGWHRVEATVTDARGRAISRTVTSDPFRVLDARVSYVVLDFPESAFGGAPLTLR